MSEQELDKKFPKNPELQNGQEENGYHFMDQTIKKRPADRRAILLRLLSIAGAGAVIGVIASLVFSLTQPAIHGIVTEGKAADKVTIPSDEQQSDETEVIQAGEAEEESTETEEELTEAEDDKESADSENGENNSQPETGEPEAEAEETVEKSGSEAEQNAEEVIADSSVEGTEETAVRTGDGTSASDGMTEDGQSVTEGQTAQTEEVQDLSLQNGNNIEEQALEQPAEAAVAEQPAEAAVEEQSTEQPEAESGKGSEDSTVKEPAGISLQEYRQLYKDMMDVADEPEHALVQVIGITREMDYFNQNYENQRRLSGLAIAMTDTDLLILTEYRVVDRVERIQVVFYDGTMTDATFQKADQNTGLAVIKVPLDNISTDTREELVTAPLGNSYKVERGEPVMALGSPLGVADSIACGIVTSIGSKVSVADTEYALLTTDIEGSADGSGVLIDLDGKIIGIITGNFESSTPCITGLAISQLKGLLEDLSNNEPRSYVGIQGQDVTQDITDRTGIPRGLLVIGVEQDSPAMLAGIKEYDVIVRVGEQAVDSMRNYQKALMAIEPETPVAVTALRRGAQGYAEIKFEVTVVSR